MTAPRVGAPVVAPSTAGDAALRVIRARAAPTAKASAEAEAQLIAAAEAARRAQTEAEDVAPDVADLVNRVERELPKGAVESTTLGVWRSLFDAVQALAQGHEDRPTLQALAGVRQKLLQVGLANALRWGTQALVDGGSEAGASQMGTALLGLADLALRVGADREAVSALEREWRVILGRRHVWEEQERQYGDHVVDQPTLAKVVEEAVRAMGPVQKEASRSDFLADIAARLTANAGMTRGFAELRHGTTLVGRELGDAVDRRVALRDTSPASPRERAAYVAYVEGLRRFCGEQVKRNGQAQAESGDRSRAESGRAWAWLRDNPEASWFARFAKRVLHIT